MDSLSNDITCANTSQNNMEPYWQNAVSDFLPAGPFDCWFDKNPPASLFEVTSRTTKKTWPALKQNGKNNILLYSGSFNPPHKGHLATIQYFYRYRKEFDVLAMFVFTDPEDLIRGRMKDNGEIVLPQELRSLMFAKEPGLSEPLEEGWLQLLLGTKEGITQALMSMTALIRGAGFDADLIGLLGGDKLSACSPPHEPPAELATWGPLDGFLTLNARRPVDFYTPGPGKGKASIPISLPGCTEWERGQEDSGLVSEGVHEESIGDLWLCKALTVRGTPTTRFYATQRSASNGVNSTRIRKIISEAGEGELQELLRDQVISFEILAEWLKKH
ncbi:hypothetical protein HYFRA_00004818 [Hymenoscyphus fraxineus]|uniref:Cytidyltransferase-like domain-containing protein n=1 Tax=Hymenoscyphus fraxineus TaxID=746836 RepID=A0A9N9KK98_9HELO|nr:hypothetical protein HYFRA_00004818 [Hymenoscyphus fraxineus]